MFTVTFLHVDGTNNVSRFCETKRVAQNWAKWLRSQSWVTEVTIFRGQAGGEVIERA